MKKTVFIAIFFFAQIVVFAQALHPYNIKADTIRIKKSVTPTVGNVLTCIDTLGDYVTAPASGGGSGWSLTGNAGLLSNNYIGTNDSAVFYIYAGQQNLLNSAAFNIGPATYYSRGYANYYLSDSISDIAQNVVLGGQSMTAFNMNNNQDHGAFLDIFQDSVKLSYILGGTLINNGQLRLNDGTQGAGKVLKSDAVGNASWTASPFIVLYSQTDTTQTVNDTTQHSLVKTGVGNMTIPANMPVGTTYQLNIRGFHSNNSFDNLVVRIKIDGTTVDSAIVTSGPGVVGGASGITANLNIYSTGNTGKYWIQGFYNEDGSTNSGMPTTSAKTLNTTTTHTVDVTIQWKTKTASDSWTVTNLTFDQRTP